MPSSSSSSSSNSDSDSVKGEVGAIGGKFMIVSKMNGKVVDVKRARRGEGVKVIMYEAKSRRNFNQLFYVDPNSIVRTARNSLVFFGEAEGAPLKTSKNSSDPRGQWRISGDRIVNGLGQCLDIKDANSSNKADLCAYRPTGGANQSWEIRYVN